ncbi:MAG: NAD(P)/FAD-dependent oxidoreductase, partial [Parachlamydiaceae bacterium]
MKNFTLLLLLLIGITVFQSTFAKENLSGKTKVYPIAVIGGGAGGTMAARRAVLDNYDVLFFTGAKQERRRSRGNWVRSVDNIPGFSRYNRAIRELSDESIQELAESPLGHNLNLINDSVVSIKKEKELFKLIDESGNVYFAQYVVLATGVMDEQPCIQGSIRPILRYANAQTIAYCAVCDGHRSFGKKTVIIGHTERAAQAALLLSDKYNHQGMTILTNGQPNQFSQESLTRMKAQNIAIKKAPILEIKGDRGILEGFKLQNGECIKSEMGFVSLGLRPNNQLALQLGARVDGN